VVESDCAFIGAGYPRATLPTDQAAASRPGRLLKRVEEGVEVVDEVGGVFEEWAVPWRSAPLARRVARR